MEIAGSEDRPDLVPFDVMMPGMDGYEVCRWLKADPRTRDVPVIFVTAMSEVDDETKGFSLGAVDYITKPVRPPVAQARVAAHPDAVPHPGYFRRQAALLRRQFLQDGGLPFTRGPAAVTPGQPTLLPCNRCGAGG